MKNKSLKIFLPALLVMIIWSCKKDEHKIYYEGNTPMSLTASRTGTIPLSFANKDSLAVKFSWNNPDYIFTTGLSSHDVSYNLEIDTTGANFGGPRKKTVVISKDFSTSFTQGAFNDLLLNELVLVPGIPHSIDVRLVSSLAGNAVPVSSNVLKYTVTPYAIPPKVTPPASGKLFIVGDATAGGWNNPVPVPSQEFTKISPTLYEITVSLIADKSYLLLPVNGDWGVKYGGLGANNTNNTIGDDFKVQGGDLKAPAVAGNYKIQVDFQRGKFTLTKL